MRGIDVSENNGVVDWGAVKANGFDFAIIRIGFGKSTLDELFYENINGAINVGLKVGVYYYSYALDELAARTEAEFVANTLYSAGLTSDKLEMGVWFDMEDADGYKERNGRFTRQDITNICSVFINYMWRNGYTNTGLYANLDWLENHIYVDQLGGCAVWAAQYNSKLDYEGATIWQYTDSENIEGQLFDGNVTLK